MSQPTAEPVPFGPAADLLRAKVLMAAIAAERARRELECQRGRYLLAEEAETAWTAQLADFLQGVEISLGDLALSLGLDHEQTTMLRKWWRRQRAEAAERCRCEAASLPEYVEDSACVGSAVTESLG